MPTEVTRRKRLSEWQAAMIVIVLGVVVTVAACSIVGWEGLLQTTDAAAIRHLQSLGTGR
jgi:hypothetical protein